MSVDPIPAAIFYRQDLDEHLSNIPVCGCPDCQAAPSRLMVLCAKCGATALHAIYAHGAVYIDCPRCHVTVFAAAVADKPLVPEGL